jgi:phosphoribosyl 1,2-cyclic phosphodiesterase
VELTTEKTRVILDAGTGIRNLGREMAGAPPEPGRETAIAITHTHWDHIQGLPFFAPLYFPGEIFTVYSAASRGASVEEVFAFQQREVYHPIPLSGFAASLSFRRVSPGDSFGVGDAKIRCCQVNHPGVTLAYRIEAGGAAVCYASDAAPFRFMLTSDLPGGKPRPTDPSEQAAVLQRMEQEYLEILRGADAYVADAFFAEGEEKGKEDWGHSSPLEQVEMCRRAGVKCLYLFHHAPGHDDDTVDRILEATKKAAGTGGPEIRVAVEGATIAVGGEKRG